MEDERNKNFYTKMLTGQNVILTSKKEGFEVRGIFKEVFERNESIVLRNYELIRNGISAELGDIIIVKSDAYVEIRCKKFKPVSIEQLKRGETQ